MKSEAGIVLGWTTFGPLTYLMLPQYGPVRCLPTQPWLSYLPSAGFLAVGQSQYFLSLPAPLD